MIIFLLLIFQLLNAEPEKKKVEYNKNILKGVYKIESLVNYQSIRINEQNKLDLFNKQTNLRIINIKNNCYYIETVFSRIRIGIENDSFKIFHKSEYTSTENQDKIIWIISHINQSQYIIINNLTKNLIEFNPINGKLQCIKQINITDINGLKDLKINYIFNFIKIFQEYEFTKEKINFVKYEPIDIIIKYIDLTDKNLKREGIKQIYKDKDNDELRYSIRSVLRYIPWIRKIFILMPNKKVKYFKEFDIIDDKIKYINDKELLGYDSANIHAFTFQLFKSEKFGVSNNFIYMEDDFFIGNVLKKSDFFYYEPNAKKVFPFLIQKYFYTLNETELKIKEDEILNIKEQIHPHSGKGWLFTIYNTELYFYNKYNKIRPIISTPFTHCARGENIGYMKEIFIDIQNYSYINETLNSKERHIFSLNQPQYNYLFKLNIKKSYNRYIKYSYIKVENLNQKNLKIPLFVINTGGNHEPSNRQNMLERRIMKKRFPFKTNYELLFEEKNHRIIEFIFFIAFRLLIAFFLFKIFLTMKNI